MEDASVEELEGEKTTTISPQISQAPYVRLEGFYLFYDVTCPILQKGFNPWKAYVKTQER